MNTNFARKIFASRIATFSIIVLISVIVSILLRSAVIIIDTKNRALTKNIITNKQRIATLRDNIGKIVQFNNIVTEYEKIQNIPIDETVNLIKTRANLFHISNPTFKITKPAVISKNQMGKLNFNFMSSTISLQYEAANDIMLFAFLDDIINKINGGVTIESFDISHPAQDGGQGGKKNIQVTAVVKWDLLNLIR